MVRLTKINFNQLKVIQLAVSSYNDHLSRLTSEYSVAKETRMFHSINAEILKDLDKKINKDFLPQNSSLKLPYHKAIVLTNAFLHYQGKLSTQSYEHSLLYKYNEVLLPQLRLT